MYKLESNSISATFDRKGSVVSIFDKRLEREFLTAKGFEKLFRIMLPSDKWDGRHADSNEQEDAKVENKTDTGITFFYPQLKKEDEIFNVAIRANIKLEDENLIFSLDVENNDNVLVSHIIYPIIGGIGKDNNDLRYYAPVQEKRVINPFTELGNWNHKCWVGDNNKWIWRYPNRLASSWAGLSSEKCGIAIESRSPAFDIVDFCLEAEIKKASDYPENNQGAVMMATQFFPNVEKGEKFSSHEFRVLIHEGDWHYPADAHRRWLEKTVKFPNTPQKFKESLGWAFYFMKQQDGTVWKTYGDMPKMAQAALDAGIPYMMLFGWQRDGHDNTYPFGYFANDDWGGADKLSEMTEKCREMGCESIPFFNGTLLDVTLKETQEYGYRWRVMGRTGSPYNGGDFARAVFDYGQGNGGGNYTTRNMSLHDICQTGKEASAWWLETIKRITETYGFCNLQLDQIAHKCYVCYDKNHGHKKPQYAYTIENAELLQKIRGQLQKHYPEAIMIGEGFNDMAAQCCDGFWSWGQIIDPEIVRFSVPWMNYSHETDALEYDIVNKCFANKILLDLKIEGGDGILSDYPPFSEHLKKLATMKKKLPDTYINGYFRDEEGIRYSDKASLCAKKYKNSVLGKECVIISNLKNETVVAEIELDHEIIGARFLDMNGDENTVDILRNYRLEMKPYEVVAVEYPFVKD